ncbi:unnamed protein product, partial [Staurois parvus]
WAPQAIGDHGAPVSLPKLKKAYENGIRGISWGPLLTPGPRQITLEHSKLVCTNSGEQGRTDNSWGPWAIGDHGAPCVLAQTQKSL